MRKVVWWGFWERFLEPEEAKFFQKKKMVLLLSTGKAYKERRNLYSQWHCWSPAVLQPGATPLWEYCANTVLCKDTPLLFKPSELVLSLTMKTSLVVIFSNTESNLLCPDPFLSRWSYRSAGFHPWPHTESPGELLKLPTIYATDEKLESQDRISPKEFLTFPGDAKIPLLQVINHLP